MSQDCSPVEAGLARGISPEVDCSGGGDPNQVGPKTPEQTWDPLLHKHLPQTLPNTAGCSPLVRQDPRVKARAGRLQPGLDHLQWAGDDGSHSASNPSGHKVSHSVSSPRHPVPSSPLLSHDFLCCVFQASTAKAAQQAVASWRERDLQSGTFL